MTTVWMGMIFHLTHHILDYLQDNWLLQSSQSVKIHFHSFPFFKLDLSNASSSYCAKISTKIVHKALGQKKKKSFFSEMLSLKLNFDKYTAQLHLPQVGRKTGAMQLRFFLYDLSFRYLSYNFHIQNVEMSSSWQLKYSWRWLATYCLN